jgi:CRP/FNR family cyclic AMP-dependent transcriptional regulator
MAKQGAQPKPDLIELVPMSDSLRALARMGVQQRYVKGRHLINEGDLGDSLYIVLSGCLRAYSVGADEREITYGEYGPGEYVGEMGLDGGPRSAHVEAAQSSLVVLVTRTTLQRHMAADPAFAFELLTKVIRRARAATVGLRRIALNKVHGRVKDLLEGLAVTQPDGRPRVDALPTHLSMSRQLGCGREMVTRVMNELVLEGYIRVEGRRLWILRKLPDKW